MRGILARINKIQAKLPTGLTVTLIQDGDNFLSQRLVEGKVKGHKSTVMSSENMDALNAMLALARNPVPNRELPDDAM